MLRLIGYGVTGTVLLNEARGKETDFRPIVNGRYNSNFLRVRDLFGRDWSLFGTWDGLARAIVTTGLGHPEDSLRGLGSGAVSMGWDMITGTSFNGERPREDLGSFGMWLLHSFTPFAMQELPEAISQIYGGSQQQDVGQVASGAGLVFGETFGAKSAPQSFLDEADSTSREIFQGQRYKDLEDYQKDDVQKAESVKRAAARRPSYGYFAALDAIEDRRLEGNSDILFLANEGALTPNEAVNKYFQVKTEARISRTQAAVDFNIEFDSNDSDAAETLIKGSGEEALAQYYQSLEDATKVEINGEIIETEIFNSRKWTEILDDLQSRWTPLQYAYVIRNTNRRELSKGILDLLEHHSKPEYERQNNAISAREQHREYIQRTGFYKTPFSAENFTIGGAIEQIRSQP